MRLSLSIKRFSENINVFINRNIRANFPNFKEEGQAFFVLGSNSEQGISIYHFQNSSLPGTYLFVKEEERQNILDNFPTFIEEGIAFKVG